MKKLFFFAVMLLFVSVGCNKDQKAVKTLDGTWQLVSENGVPVEGTYVQKVAYSNCKLKKDEYCNVTVTISDLGDNLSFSGQYKILDKGETMETKFTIFGETTISRAKITELTKSVLKIESTENNIVSTEEYKKV